ncbi:MAG: NAD(P)-dependent oxidoreductase [Caldilineaceae bacterium]|nr:NAD(P)-dependent oxidoreductase [Caldilineaceae bacterium]
MKILILGGAGMLGPYVARELADKHSLRITDVKEPAEELPGDFFQLDVSDLDAVVEAAEGMDAIVNLSVLRRDRQIAWDVSTRGCYNMMQAAVTHGIRRVINTGPHLTVAGRNITECFDFGIGPDIPPQSGTYIYAITKAMGQEICRVFTLHHDISVQTYLFCHFVDPRSSRLGDKRVPYAVSWENAAEAFTLGLDIDLDALPSRCEVFFVFADMPHGKYSNEKAKRILGFQPRRNVELLWT